MLGGGEGSMRQHGEQPDRRSERQGDGEGGWLARLWVGRRMESDESKVLPPELRFPPGGGGGLTVPPHSPDSAAFSPTHY